MENSTNRPGNVFSQTSAAFSAMRDQRAAAARKAQERATNAEVNKIFSFRSDETTADEILWAIVAILCALTAFTGYYSAMYYYSVFSEIFPPVVAGIVAVVLALVTEIAKVYLVNRALRSIFFGWMFENWWAVGYYAIAVLLGSGAFWWSIRISTISMKEYTERVADEGTRGESLLSRVSAATASIDSQLLVAQNIQKAGIEKKNKRGKTTNAGLYAAGGQNATIESLQKQRQTLVDNVTADYQKGEGKREKQVSAWAKFVENFGGYSELAQFLCLIGIGIAERRLVEKKRDIIAQKEAEEQLRQEQMQAF